MVITIQPTTINSYLFLYYALLCSFLNKPIHWQMKFKNWFKRASIAILIVFHDFFFIFPFFYSFETWRVQMKKIDWLIARRINYSLSFIYTFFPLCFNFHEPFKYTFYIKCNEMKKIKEEINDKIITTKKKHFFFAI